MSAEQTPSKRNRPVSRFAALAALAVVPGLVQAQDRIRPMEFDGYLVWTRTPVLMRMIPDAEAPAGRRPANPAREEDREELAKPVVNVIVLVHGHNEAEKDGSSSYFDAGTEPWQVHYKRDVWTLLYQTWSNDETWTDRRDVRGCTAFYEYIYPSYWPIFTPVRGQDENLLGLNLAQQLAAGAENDGRFLNRRLAARERGRFNLSFIAHSMGGLVVRAAMREFAPEVRDSFRLLVTWGTPHHGAPLETLGALLHERYNVRLAQMRLPAENVVVSEAFQWYLNSRLRIDTPGVRDLRWDNGTAARPRPLRLDDIFEVAIDRLQEDEFPVFNLVDGTWLYNPNLRYFNETDPYRFSDKYLFMYGVTTKVYPAQRQQTARGALVNRILIENPDEPMPEYGNRPQAASDGATPLASMVGVGIARPDRTWYLGDVDHEEYFGTPTAGTWPDATARERGEFTARETIYQLRTDNEECRCPEIVVTAPFAEALPAKGKPLRVTARFELPKSLEPLPGGRIRAATAHLRVPFSTTGDTPLGAMKVEADGTMSGEFTMPGGDETEERSIVVRAALADGTIVEGAHLPTRPTRYRLTALKIVERKGAFRAPWAENYDVPAIERMLRAPNQGRLTIPDYSDPGAEKQVALERADVPADELMLFFARTASSPEEAKLTYVKDEGTRLRGQWVGVTTGPEGTPPRPSATWGIDARIGAGGIRGTLTYDAWYFAEPSSQAPKAMVEYTGNIKLSFEGEPVE